ncbi:Uncharacterized conserved protein, DUF1800 family [Spirosomataceae bacterium TFI 002]|nr:Uncharacterized conserved protein, DUF1800 family [Spirosomataceae bacterium TFI 002]
MPNTLTKYNGKWEHNHAKHVLNRLGFGADFTTLDNSVKNGFEKTIDNLLAGNDAYDAPLNDYSNVGEKDSSGVGFGESWVSSAYDGDLTYRRKISFRNWMLMRMVEEPSAREKMFLFWHNHFATELNIYNDARYGFLYYEVLRKNAFGNFKTMLKEITLTPAMLIYLNTVDNKVGAPDENYARELQELFTIGKEYENRYTEEDVQQAAKVLTGYVVIRNAQSWDLKYTFVPNRHDTSDKTFTTFYGNKVITGKSGSGGEQELDELIEMILAKDQVSEHICRNLYRYFVHSDIGEGVENGIIKPLAKTLRDNNYELKPVYESLFKSEHFLDPKFHGSMIKSPVEYVVGTLKAFEAKGPDSIKEKYAVFNQVFNRASRMQQQVGDTPNVSGWAAYYQEPSFYKIWINSATLAERTAFIQQLLAYNGFANNSQRLKIDHVAFASKIKNVSSPDDFLGYLFELIYTVKPNDTTKASILKDILSDGKDDKSVWTDQWDKMINNPTNQTYYLTVERKLKKLFNHLAQLPEYHLC